MKWRNNLGIEELTGWYRNKPATNPEKKKFTHAKVRVWSTRKYKHNQLSNLCNYSNKGQAIAPPHYSYIINNQSVLTKERKLCNCNTWGIIIERFFFIISIAMFGSENICAWGFGAWPLGTCNSPFSCHVATNI